MLHASPLLAEGADEGDEPRVGGQILDKDDALRAVGVNRIESLSIIESLDNSTIHLKTNK